MDVQISEAYTYLKQPVAPTIAMTTAIEKNRPLILSQLSVEQFHYELACGINDIEAGRTYSADEVEAEMKRLCSL